MSTESWLNPSGNKAERYQQLLPQLAALLAEETDTVAKLANTSSALQQSFAWLWVGFYRVDVPAQQLVLGPFQGPPACGRIAYNRGVCGQAWARQETLIVPDVTQFPGHIACSARSRSEIVVPVHKQHGQVVAVLDADAEQIDQFDAVDALYLQQIATWVADCFGEDGYAPNTAR